MKTTTACLSFGTVAGILLAHPLEAGLPDLSKMNILFICPEDWSAEAIGAYGNKEVRTPNLDKLATESTVFTKAYCQNPVCNPSRSSFLTGLRSETSGIFANPDRFESTIPEWAVSLPETLQRHPIRTYMIGKLFHHNWEAKPQVQAFDGIYRNAPKGYQGRVLQYAIPKGTPQNPPRNWTFAPDPEWDRKLIQASERRAELWEDAPKGSRQWDEGRRIFQDLSAEVVGESGDIAERNADGRLARVTAELVREHGRNGRQFFISVGFSRPHTPLRAPAEYFDLYDPKSLTLTHAKPELDSDIPPVAKRFGRNWDLFKIRARTPEAERTALHGYYACASFIDDQIGLILKALDAAGTADQTIVIFTSDHGFHLGEHGMWSKISLFEQSTRVPLMVRIPGVTGGASSQAIVELVDLYPTLCEVLGIDKPHDRLEGISLLPVIENPSRHWKKAAFTDCKQGQYLGRSVRTRSCRYTEWVEFNKRDEDDGPVRFKELYDLETDPLEQHNLVGQPASASLEEKMAALLKNGWRHALPAPE
jgi:uncharacterized sulfatase